MALKVKKDDLAKLLGELGYQDTTSWNVNRLSLKMKGLPKVVNEDKQPKTADSTKLLKLILKALKDSTEIEITGGDAKAAKAAAPAKGKDKKPAKAAKEEPEDDEEEEEESEDTEEEEEEKSPEEEEDEAGSDEDSEGDDEESEDEEEESEDSEDEEEDEDAEEDASAKSTKKGKKGKKDKASGEKKTKKAKVAKGPGVIDTIEAILREAGEKGKGIKKDAIADKLGKRFPERERDSMLKTVNVQVPTRISADRNIKVVKDDDGYMIKPGKAK